MASPEPVFISPLLGADGAWSGYHVEFAPGEFDGKTLEQLYEAPLLDEFDHRAPWFVPVTEEANYENRLGERVIPVFPATPPTRERESLKALEAHLRLATRPVALAAAPDQKLPGTGCWNYLLIASSHARSLPPFTLLGLSSRTKLVCTEVHTHNDREWGVANACDLSTGEFLQTRSPANTKADITRIKLLKLLALIVDDADTEALDAIFREEQKLSYSLLRLVNSAALSPRTPISSFSQAINLLGRRQLQRWLQLLVYSDPNDGQHPNPLLQKAASRGRLLELLAPHLADASTAEHCTGDITFMIGTFSLLDVLLNVAMPSILSQLPLPAIAQRALAEHGGALGELLDAIAAADRRELKVASSRLKALGIDAKTYLDAQLEAFSWASKIHPPG